MSCWPEMFNHGAYFDIGCLRAVTSVEIAPSVQAE